MKDSVSEACPMDACNDQMSCDNASYCENNSCYCGQGMCYPREIGNIDVRTNNTANPLGDARM